MREIILSAALLFATAAKAQPSRTPFLSVVNSTTTPLASGATFTGTWEQCFHWSSMSTAVATDLDGTLRMQFSPDGTNVDSSLSFDIKAGVIEPPHKLEVFRRYCRVTFTNDGSGTQSYLRIQTIFGSHSVPMAPLSLAVNPDADAIMTKGLDQEFLIGTGGLVGLSKINKFGKNEDVDGAEDIWDGGGNVTIITPVSTYPGFPTGTAEAVEVLSLSANDDEGGSGCEKVTIEGLDASFAIQSEEITLNGTAAVDSAGTYKRVYRAYCSQSANGANTAFNADEIVIRWTTTTSVVFAVIEQGANQSQVCTYTIPAGKTGYLRDFGVSVSKNTANAVVTGHLWFSEGGYGVNPPRKIRPFTASGSAPYYDYIYSAISFPEKTDIKVQLDSASTTNISVTCNMDIFLVDNI